MTLFYIRLGYLLLSLTCLLVVLLGMRKALQRTESEKAVRKRIFTRVLLALTSWLTVISLASASGLFQEFGVFPPRMFLFLWFPVVVLIWILRNDSTSKLLKALPPQWLFYIQVFRVPVELLLWQQFLLGLTPVQMTLEGQNFDILIGLSGPFVGFLIARKHRWATAVGLVWNVFGVGLLLNIVVISILSFPSPIRVFMNEPANTLIAQFPIAFLSLVLVPLAYYMHALSIKQLLQLRSAHKTKQIVSV